MSTSTLCQIGIHSQASHVVMFDSELSVILKDCQVLFFLLPGIVQSARLKPEGRNTTVGNKFPLPSRSSSDLGLIQGLPSVLGLCLVCLLPNHLASNYSSEWLLNKFACEIETKQKALRPGEHQRSLSKPVQRTQRNTKLKCVNPAPSVIGV